MRPLLKKASSSVAFSYDAANRRTSLTLPNGITLAYSYDQDSRVTGMTWTLGGNPVGNLGYSYDADGRVTAKIGSFAQTNLPQAVSGNTFNAANELTGFNSTALSYDLNGNLTGDGTNTYTWDARNHLASISGGTTASFVYDAFGRRTSKNINGSITQFEYDGLNPVQELDGANPASVTANLLTGLRIDEFFQRTDLAGLMDFLSDTLGSTLALSDSTGEVQTQYTYEPFGNVTASGTANSNQYQFTGRENDGTGLQFNRTRYYSPSLQRFISQDPIGFAGGDANLYAYVSNDPANLIDPLGLDAFLCDRPIKGFSKEHGPLYHQFICVERNGANYCFGLTTSFSGWRDIPNLINGPGTFEADKPNGSCKKQSTQACVDSCLLGVYEGSPPDYSLVDFFGMQCHQFATSTTAFCRAKCAGTAN